MVKQTTSEWIAVEWSRERLRVWIMGADGSVIERLMSERGTSGLSPDEYEGVLGALIAGHLDDDVSTEIMIAGEPSAPGLWGAGAPVSVPCKPPTGAQFASARMRDGRMSVKLVTGVSQGAPAGLMLADTVRIAGFLAVHDAFDGVIALPGLRSRWVHVSAGEIVSFQTFLTHELARAALVEMNLSNMSPEPSEALLDAAEASMSKPEAIGRVLGSNRAQNMLQPDVSRDVCDTTFGAFIGLELAAARPYWLGQRVAMIGAGAPLEVLRLAGERQGIFAEISDEEDMLLAGFRALRAPA